MAGITFSKFRNGYIILACISGVACAGFAVARLFINYAIVSTVSQAAGLEYALTYSTLAVTCLIFTILALICRDKSKMQSPKALACYVVSTLVVFCVICAVSNAIPNTSRYMAAEPDASVEKLYPIDQLEFSKEPKERVYFYKQVQFGKTYWCGGSDRFTFAPSNSKEESNWNYGDGQAVLTYYYLYDPTMRRLQENDFKTAFSTDDVEEGELEDGGYHLCNYGTYSQVTYRDKVSAFSMTAPHTANTKYTDTQVLGVGKALHQFLQSRSNEA